MTAPFCFAPGCEMAGTKWPTVLIRQTGNAGSPFRLEIPRAVCAGHQPEFRPEVFLPDAARDYLRFLAKSWREAEPDFEQISVEWLDLDHPAFTSMDGSEACFRPPLVVL